MEQIFYFLPGDRYSADNDVLMTIGPISEAELVFGLVYPVGVDADPVAGVLKDYLVQFNYKCHPFRVSDHLRSLELGIEYDDSSPRALMNALMDAGNRAREITKTNEILAIAALNEILDSRPKGPNDEGEPAPRVAHLIRSLKRPEEVRLLREVYRPGFFLIAIAADDDEQMKYLKGRKGLTEEEAAEMMTRDEDEQVDFGQRTRDTFYLADVFVQLGGEHYKEQLQDFLDLVFGHPFITPKREEHAMFMAYSSSARSAQLARQVGAAISTPAGEVLAVGFNEVPCRGGGPCWQGDTLDFRDHKLKADSNFENRMQIIGSIVEKLNSKLLFKRSAAAIIRATLDAVATRGQESTQPGPQDSQVEAILSSEAVSDKLTDEATVKRLIDSSDLSEITEYGRAVHAEMDAILTCSRLGIPVKGAFLFTTTFPCHNCTRHIIASGISKVVYIEPYPKSKAKKLHSDAICFDEEEAKKTGKIPFVPFVGIGPRRYLDLFSQQLSTGRRIERKTARRSPSSGTGEPMAALGFRCCRTVIWNVKTKP